MDVYLPEFTDRSLVPSEEISDLIKRPCMTWREDLDIRSTVVLLVPRFGS